MTSQKSKSPEEIINECLLMDPSHFFSFRDEMDSRKYSSWIASIKEKLVSAIKAERENNRLVLPERKEVSGKVNYEVWANVGWNNCLDEITRLNEGRVKPDAVWEDILIEKNNEDIGTHMNISLDDFINCYSNMKLNTKYRVEFYKLDEGEK